MEYEHYDILCLYVQSLVNSPNVQFNMLGAVINSCPRVFRDAVNNQEFNLDSCLISTSCSVDSKSLVSISYGVCLFLAKSNWKYATSLIGGIVTMLNSTVVPLRSFKYIYMEKVTEDQARVSSTIWSSVSILPCTLCSYASTLDKEDSMVDAIVDCVASFWLRSVKQLAQRYIQSPKHAAGTQPLPASGPPEHIDHLNNWQTMLILFYSKGMFLCLSAAALEKYILANMKPDGATQTPLVDVSQYVINKVLRMMMKLVEKNICGQLPDVTFSIPSVHLRKRKAVNLSIEFLTSMISLVCSIGKVCRSQENNSHLNKALSLELWSKVTAKLSCLNVHMDHTVKIESIRQLCEYDKKVRNDDDVIIFVESALRLVEHVVGLLTEHDYNDIEELTNYCFSQFSGLQSAKWPPHPRDLLVRYVCINGIISVINNHPNLVEKLNIIGQLKDILVRPTDVMSVVQANTDAPVIACCPSTLLVQNLHCHMDEPLEMCMNNIMAFCVFFKQRLINLFVDALERALTAVCPECHECSECPEVLHETISFFGLFFLKRPRADSGQPDSVELDQHCTATISCMILGLLGIKFHDIQPLLESVLSLLSHRFMQPVSILDVHIVNQMANLMISIQDDDIYFTVMGSFKRVFLRVVAEGQTSEGTEDTLKYTCLAISAAFQVISCALTKEELSLRFLQDTLEIYIECSICQRKLSKSNLVLPYLTKYLNYVVSSISCSIDRVGSMNAGNPKLQQLFKNFWVFLVVTESTNTSLISPEMRQHYSKISKFSPPLVVDHLRSDLRYNISLKDNTLEQLELGEMRSLLLRCLDCDQIDIVNHISRLPLMHIIFLLAIMEQESYAVGSDSSRFPNIFEYLDDVALESDKQNIGVIVEYTCDKIFEKFMRSLTLRLNGRQLDQDLVQHTKLLMVKFNSELKRAQKCADKYLSILFNKFPHMLWNSSVVLMMLDYVHVLEVESANLGDSCETTTIIVPQTTLTYMVPDSRERRELILKDYKLRCSTLIKEATRCAPAVVVGILLEYLTNKTTSFNTSTVHHHGIDLLISSIMSATPVSSQDPKWQYRAEETTPPELSASKPDLSTQKPPKPDRSKLVVSSTKDFGSNIGGFVSACTLSATLRAYYLGKLEGILLRLNCGGFGSCYDDVSFTKFIFDKLDVNGDNVDDELADSAILATSYMVCRKKMDKKILRRLCKLPIRTRRTDLMKTVIECWEWISSSSPSLQIPMMHAIWNVWDKTMTNEWGMFNMCSNKRSMDSGLVSASSSIHDMWITFLMQRMDVVKFYSPEQMMVIFFLVSQSIHYLLFTGINRVYLEFHVVPFLRLIALGLKLIQNVYLTNSMCRSVLREKVFRVLTAYFGVEMTWHKFDTSSDVLELLCLIYCLLLGDRKWNNATNAEMVTFASSTLDVRGFQTLSNRLSVTISHLDLPMSTVGNATIKQRSRFRGFASKPETLQSCDAAANSNTLTQSSGISFAESGILLLNNDETAGVRMLLVHMLGREIERISTWVDPLNKSEKLSQYSKNVKSFFSGKDWVGYIKTLWKLEPRAIVYLSQRFIDHLNLCREVTNLVRLNPIDVIHNDYSARLFWSSEPNTPAVPQSLKPLLLLWARTSVIVAVGFVSERLYSPSVVSTQYAVSTLKCSSLEDVLSFIPQLVQTLRYDVWGYIEQYILWVSQRTSIISHQFIWNLQTNKFTNEEGTLLDPVIGYKLDSILQQILSNYNVRAKKFYESEFDFFGKITAISTTMRGVEPSERKTTCRVELSKIEPQFGVYLPTNPDSLIVGIDYTSGVPMQSAAKTPFLARFEVVQASNAMIEDINTKDVEIPPEVLERKAIKLKAAIFKVGDDVRQDILALQIMKLFKDIFVRAGLSLKLFPYKVVATDPGAGVIECVTNAKSRHELGKQTDADLMKYFINTYGNENSLGFKQARENFSTSLAAYSVFGYMLQVKDRHNGNIMINSDGCIIHIDFGFLLDSSPGGNINFEPDIKLTGEMLNVLGGNTENPYFKSFVRQCIKGYLAIRPYHDEVVNLVSLMLDTGLPCFRGDTIRRLKTRFALNYSEREASQFFERIVNDNLLNIRTVLYDKIQQKQNSISC